MAYSSSLGIIRVRDANNTSTWYKIPLKYISYENYKVTPQQMIDLDSYVSETGTLIRNVLDHTRTKIEWETPYITSDDWNALWQNYITPGITDAKARKVRIQYYNPLTDAYRTAWAYIPDIEFTIRNVDEASGVINYNAIRIAFIEY